ncbi:hypothetical protein ACI2KR_06575 [Pseudomonas luteola]
MLLNQDLMVVIETKVVPPSSILELNEPTVWLKSMIAEEAIEYQMTTGRRPEQAISLSGPSSQEQPLATRYLRNRHIAALMYAHETFEVSLSKSTSTLRFRFENTSVANAEGAHYVPHAVKNEALMEGVITPFINALWRSGTGEARILHELPSKAQKDYLLALWTALRGACFPLLAEDRNHAWIHYTLIDGSHIH